MPEPLTTLGPAWALVAAGALLALTLVVGAVTGAADARAADRPLAAGALAPLREAARLLRQRRRSTISSDRLLWRAATASALPVAVLMVAVVPLGHRALFDSPVGVVWVNALDVLIWAVVWLAGWGPNSIHPLVGGYRFLALALGYELPLMFALVAPAVAAGSLRLGDVVAAQAGLWYVAWMPVAFLVVCLGVLAFSVTGPFGAVAAGDDLAGGVLAESSGPDRLALLAGREALLVAGSAVTVTLFLGGGAGPLLPGWAWLVVKTLVLATGLALLGRHLPALRPDRFVEAAWVVLLPATVLQDLVVAVVAVGGS